MTNTMGIGGPVAEAVWQPEMSQRHSAEQAAQNAPEPRTMLAMHRAMTPGDARVRHRWSVAKPTPSPVMIHQYTGLVEPAMTVGPKRPSPIRMTPAG